MEQEMWVPDRLQRWGRRGGLLTQGDFINGAGEEMWVAHSRETSSINLAGEMWVADRDDFGDAGAADEVEDDIGVVRCIGDRDKFGNNGEEDDVGEGVMRRMTLEKA
ncbi:unnamed protein product [Sphenostylis stenocarpa]|uniref:Uncharacterized protein n=1 Tax=Sphenostylis stenocarpa TaxID=92480 RepID=A0AA86VLV0_9FABA|nr:unnamed protein product [Sphenostylis stenocarpa]